MKRVDFGAPRELVFAAIQLAPPGLIPVTGDKTYRWDPDLAYSQIEDARQILAGLFKGEAGKKPDVIAFSEYSLPPEAYSPDQIPFQVLSNQHRCIIIAGSYFQSEQRQPHFRNNLCSIFLPGETEPLVLHKANPARLEEPFLLTSDDAPNIARLVWEPTGEEPVSINVFLCRDYLQPFQKRRRENTDEKDDQYERVSLLDWERKGINIVVLQNDEPALFESAASFDVRRLHGQRKLVLLVNSANDQNQLATALFGPNPDRSRERDFIARIPSKEIGVLIFEASLWKVVSRADNPDTELTFPVTHFERFILSPREGKSLTAIEREEYTPKYRGIFHPAFLKVMDKYIVIELFVARSTARIEKAASEGKIDFVSASYVRGIEDVLIRRYVEGYSLTESAPGTIPSLSDRNAALPYSRLWHDEFALAFDTGPQSSHLRVLIDPRNIKKFRGKPVPALSESEWISLSAEIAIAAHGREALEEIIAIATELPPDREIPPKYSSVFFGKETVVPIGGDSQMRDTYLFVSAENEDESPSPRRFRDFIDMQLMGDVRVRDVYLIEARLLSTHPPILRGPFQFLIRLKCSIFEADDVVRTIQKWAARANVRVGTRSYDAWLPIKRAGTKGILGSHMTKEEGALQKALFNIDPEFAFESHEIQERFADILSKHIRSLSRIRSSDRWNETVTDLTKFVHYVCAFNCTKNPAKRKRFSEEAGTYFNRLFKYLEAASHLMLIDTLQLDRTANRSEVLGALTKRNPECFNKNGRAKDAGYFFWFGVLNDILGQDSPTSKLARQTAHLISPSRNIAVHGSAGNDLEVSVAVAGEKWHLQFDALDDKLTAMCRMITAFAEALHERKLE